MGWSDLWVSPNEFSSLLLAPCLKERQALAVYPRALQPSLVTLSPGKRETVPIPYIPPQPQATTTNVRVSWGVGQGGSSSLTLAKGRLTLIQGNLVKG